MEEERGVNMIVSLKSAKTTLPVPGITRRILAHSEKVMLTEHTLETGAILPEHNHPHEQVIYIISGELVLEMNGEHFKLIQGDSIAVPSNVNHKATALKASVALDIFAPARTDYL
jgi:quercetin dioxygenase-like cupin family protein